MQPLVGGALFFKVKLERKVEIFTVQFKTGKKKVNCGFQIKNTLVVRSAHGGEGLSFIGSIISLINLYGLAQAETEFHGSNYMT